MTAKIPMPDPALAWFGRILQGAPAKSREKLIGHLRKGAEEHREGKDWDWSGTEVPPNELIERHKAEIRRAALRDAVPAGRVERVRAGLACLDAADQHPAQLRAWLADPDALTAILVGPTGSGKTEAAYASAVEAVTVGAAIRDRGVVKTKSLLVRAWTVAGYLAELRPDGSPDPVWAIRNRARVAELLILDDVGAELDGHASQHARTELVELMSYRLDRDLRTILTTNLRSEQLKDKVGAPLMSRLKQQCVLLEFTGPDRRDLNDLSW